MTTSTPAPITIDLHGPGELLAATPHLLGFSPRDSVLLIGHGGDRDRVGSVLRADLPPLGDEAGLAASLRLPLLRGGASAVTVAVVGHHPGERANGPPHRALVDELANLFATAEVPVRHSVWAPEIVRGARWSCYDDVDCRGEIPDPGSSPLAAATAHAGLVTYPSRHDMVSALLEEASPEVLQRRSELLDARVDELAGVEREDAVAEGFLVVRSAVERSARGELSFTDRQVVDMAMALAMAPVRDAALAIAIPSGSALARAAEQVWFALLRETPIPERAQAASLLAYSAYVRGEGPLAGMATAIAREADPGHVLAGLLEQALGHAMPPQRMMRLARACDGSPLGGSPPSQAGMDHPAAQHDQGAADRDPPEPDAVRRDPPERGPG
ncbi:DUF4192 domain-containing protein [Saccharomonospora sp. NPDC006951]